MKTSNLGALLLSAALFVAAGPAFAAGCLKGAVVGGVAGHYAGHHAVLGAVGGCVVGHHLAKKQAQDHAAAMKAETQQTQAQVN
jgi:outer membrane lipoprotein SlyB